MRSKKKNDFEVLVGRIQATSDALQQDALVVINRSVTTRAWLTGNFPILTDNQCCPCPERGRFAIIQY